ncbi:MAG: hypothetical protein R3B70_01210 [Polyangiaceae bacterium]
MRAAFPGEEVVWLSAESPFEEVVKGMGATAIVLVEANTERRLRRARWARAAAQRQSRVVLMAGAQEAPGFWPVHDRQMRLIDAQKKLGKVGIVGPGGVAAMLDLEPEAMELLTQAVKQRRADTTKQLTEALDHMDSGAALDRLIEPSKWLDALDWELPPLIEQICPLRMRAHFNRPAARAQWARYLRLDGALKTNREAWLRGWGEPHDWLNHVGVVAPHIQDRAQGLELAEDALRLSPPVPVWIELVLRFQPEDRFDLLLIAAARLAQMGEGDVIAWTLRSVRDSYVASVLAPVLPQLAGETDEDVLLETLHGAIARMRRSWKAEVVWTAVAHAETSRLLSWVLAFGSALACALSLGLRHDIAFKVSSAAFVVAFIVLLWVEIAARRSTPGLRVRNLTTRLADIEKKLVPTRAMRVSQIQSTLQRIHEDIGAERGGESEAAARQAVQDVSVDLKSTPLHAEAVFLLASILRGDGRQKEAEEIIAPLFAASGVPLSKGLLTLAARLLAETGRAAAAVQGLLHLTELDLPSALNLRPSPAPAGAGDPLVTRMLLEPPGVLAGEPEAHLTLVDALLKQGRYPEALLVAREATARFTDRDEKAVAELKARCLDLERRTGAARAG